MSTTTAERKRKKEAPVWSRTFEGAEDVRVALEQYPIDESTTRIIRDEGGGGQDPCPLSEPGDCDRCAQTSGCAVALHAAQRRSEIDACMEILEQTYPFYQRLLDLYYRCGASAEVKGWIKAGRRVGLRSVKCPDLVRCTMHSLGDEPEDNRRERPSCQSMLALSCLWDRDTFNRQITEGIERLFVVHERRRGK